MLNKASDSVLSLSDFVFLPLRSARTLVFLKRLFYRAAAGQGDAAAEAVVGATLMVAVVELPCPRHTHLGKLAEPSGTLLRRAHREADSSRQLPLYPAAGSSIRQYLDHHNAQPKPFLRTKSADDILNSLAKYCERTSDSGH
jgi:hypothetical protein